MKKVVTFGELLLSLSVEGHSRLTQAEIFRARYTGAEANSAVSLALFGVEAFVVSKVPSHDIGQACINMLRRFGVQTNYIARGGDRLGVLYMEAGASQRATKVIYDRAPSSFRQLTPDDFDWDTILSDKDWFHFSGTAPALGPAVVDVLKTAVSTAKRHGLTVSCDCNYRSKLSSMEEAGRALTPLLEHADVLICGKDDPQRIFGVQPERDGLSDTAFHEHIAELMRKRFGLKTVAMTFREPFSASLNGYSAILCNDKGVWRSRRYEIQIVDRVGTGDAFTAGLIFGLASDDEPQHAIDFAVAASCLKHTIPGDFNLATREEVEELLAGNSSGRVQR